jgi:hypothetical protein
MDTNSTFKGLVIPVLSAITLSVNGTAQVSVCSISYEPTITVPVDVDHYKTYYTKQDSDSNKTIEINSDAIDLISIKSFAERYINNLTPIHESIQAVIDDYFWEML